MAEQVTRRDLMKRLGMTIGAAAASAGSLVTPKAAEAQQKFTEISIANAFRRGLSAPEGQVVQRHWQGFSSPPDVDSNDRDVTDVGEVES